MSKFLGWRWLGWSVLCGLGLSLSLETSAIAAGQVVLKYRFFQRSIAVEDLSALAETGEVSRPLQVYLRLAGRRPRQVRQALTREVEISPILLDRGLNNPVGNLLLDQIGQAIYPPSGEANRQAMRAALVLSASDDSRISLIEVIENYPTQQVVVDGDRLQDAYVQLRSWESRVEDLLNLDLPNLF